MYGHNLSVVKIILVISQLVIIAQTCSVRKIATAEELVSQAQVIVRGRALSYAKAPSDSNGGANGFPTSVISFDVEEIVKNRAIVPTPLLINGYLSQNDDFNDHPPPYTFVRPSGRSGSCSAHTYKQNASFLLFLNEQMTPYWSALAPTNEQLRSPLSTDRWLQWVKNQVSSSGGAQNTNQFLVSSAARPRLFFF